MGKKKSAKGEMIPVEVISAKIFLVRNEKVMIDRDLADLYEIQTSNLNKAVTRNIDRFPDRNGKLIWKPE